MQAVSRLTNPPMPVVFGRAGLMILAIAPLGLLLSCFARGCYPALRLFSSTLTDRGPTIKGQRSGVYDRHILTPIMTNGVRSAVSATTVTSRPCDPQCPAVPGRAGACWVVPGRSKTYQSHNASPGTPHLPQRTRPLSSDQS